MLGPLFMPYFSGLGNLIFVAVVLNRNEPAEEIAVNVWADNLTILCLLLALPNAVLAFYYAWKLRGDVVYSSQVGDGHICIPLCIGRFAIFEPMPLPTFFQSGLLFLSAVAVAHLVCVLLLRGLPKLVAAGSFAVYGYALFVQIST